jgi:Flp pilus assembly protein TadG
MRFNGGSRPKFISCASGAAILEFALALPILLALLAGVLELGRALFVYTAMDRTLRASSRSLARLPDPTCTPVCSATAAREIKRAEQEIAAATGLPLEVITVAPDPSPPAGTVVLQARLQLRLEWLGLLGPSPFLTMTAVHQEQRIAE